MYCIHDHDLKHNLNHSHEITITTIISVKIVRVQEDKFGFKRKQTPLFRVDCLHLHEVTRRIHALLSWQCYVTRHRSRACPDHPGYF